MATALCDTWYYGTLLTAIIAFVASVVLAALRWAGADSRCRQIILCAIVVTVVGVYRAVFPLEYGTRRAWHDSPFNAPVVIRMIALVAELCIAYIFYLTVRGGWPGFFVVAPILFAEIVSTLGTYSSIGWLFVAEESLWSVSVAVLLAVAIGALARGATGKQRDLAIVGVVGCGLFVGYEAVTMPFEASEPGRISELSWTDTSNSGQSCEGYVHTGLAYQLFHAGYFAMVGPLMVYMQTCPTL
jgi:hypothetical protein